MSHPIGKEVKEVQCPDLKGRVIWEIIEED